ncbi:hypothetical protein ALC53_14091 [Atta colombica]|uniref:Copia protein n=1 Tax=Atta colombica TaxID=520822 RepID=A0A195ATQ7_9HYME|nr:hypothetical protein ALC53_14091 [Atta colombica]
MTGLGVEAGRKFRPPSDQFCGCDVSGDLVLLPAASAASMDARRKKIKQKNRKKIKECDNKREYVNKNIYDWCKEKNIELNTTISHTSQNADRKVTAFGADMDKEMWRKALYTATYLLNRNT